MFLCEFPFESLKLHEQITHQTSVTIDWEGFESQLHLSTTYNHVASVTEPLSATFSLSKHGNNNISLIMML